MDERPDVDSLMVNGTLDLRCAKDGEPASIYIYMDVSENSGTPKSSILIGLSIINHPFWGAPIFGNTYIYVYVYILIYIFV